MKILLLGKNGQVGWELQRSLAPLGELISLDRYAGDGLCGDLLNRDGLRAMIRRIKADVIVNAAAYNSVDKAESEPEMANAVNALAVQVMVEEAEVMDSWLIRYSSDNVLGGQARSPWRETDPTCPLNLYGESKLAGEQAIQASGCKHLIFRTSWIHGARGHNFAKTILRLAKERETVSVIADQIGAPTGSDLIADVTALALQQVLCRPELLGLYHLAASGKVSWHGYASHVIHFAKENDESLAVKSVDPIETSAYPAAASRPLNSRLNTQKLRDNFSLHLPD